MTRGLVVVAAGVALATAQTTLPDFEDADAEEAEGFLAGTLLPDGSILKDVVLPNYDENLRMTSSVKADELKIITRKKLKATNLLIDFFNPDRSRRARIAMANALFRVSKNLLTTEQPVSLVSDDLNVEGSGLAFDTENNRGFIRGPVTAVARSTDTRTSMNASPKQRAIAAGTLFMAATSALPAQEPPLTTAERFANARLTEEERAQVTADAAPRGAQVAAQAGEHSDMFGEIEAESENARITMNSFLQAASLTNLLAGPAGPGTPPDVPRPEALNDPGETTVKSSKGAYFDSQEGLLIFLGDVTVKNPELDLQGADEVKLFLEPKKDEVETTRADKPGDPVKPDAPAKKPEISAEQAEKMKAAKLAKTLQEAATAEKGGAGGGFGDVTKMVATGPAVRVKYNSGRPGDKPIEASAHTVVYDFKEQQIILEGGSPWVIQEGVMQGQANGPGAYILVHTDEDGNLTKVVAHTPEGDFTGMIKTPGRSKEDPKPNAR